MAPTRSAITIMMTSKTSPMVSPTMAPGVMPFCGSSVVGGGDGVTLVDAPIFWVALVKALNAEISKASVVDGSVLEPEMSTV